MTQEREMEKGSSDAYLALLPSHTSSRGVATVGRTTSGARVRDPRSLSPTLKMQRMRREREKVRAKAEDEDSSPRKEAGAARGSQRRQPIPSHAAPLPPSPFLLVLPSIRHHACVARRRSSKDFLITSEGERGSKSRRIYKDRTSVGAW